MARQPALNNGMIFHPSFDAVFTDVDLHQRLLTAFALEDEQDGAEGLPVLLTPVELGAKTPSHSPSSNSPTHPSLTAEQRPQPGAVKKDRQKAQSQQRTVKRRLQHANDPESYRMPNFYRTPRLSTVDHVPQPTIIKTELDSEALPVARHCWVGRNLVAERSTPWSRDELLAEGFKLIQWDGNPQIVTDKDGRAVVVLVGPPTNDDSSWADMVNSAAATMAAVREEGIALNALPNDAQSHRHGSFVALAVGVSHGNGRPQPGNLFHPPKRVDLIRRLLDDKSFQRIAGYQSSVYSYYAPKLYARTCHRLLRVFQHHRNLQCNFTNSVFPAASFNLGPATVSIDHTDAGNVGYGLCALTSLGSFDSSKGGHLVLFDLGIMMEFKPGFVALLPSGILRHGNTTIAEGEERYSIAQYCAGGLLRWVEYGYRTAVSIVEKNSKQRAQEILAALDGCHEERVEQALSLFSKVDELDADRRSTFRKFGSFLKTDFTKPDPPQQDSTVAV